MASKAKLRVLTPKEVAVLRFATNYGTLTIYSPTKTPLTSERILFLLEEAKFEILHRRKH